MFMINKKVPLAVAAVILFCAGLAAAQPEIHAVRLHNPARVKGFIGGESHDVYVFRGIKGQTMTVSIEGRNGENGASFGVLNNRDVYSASPVKFGKSSNDGNKWVGKVPRTRDYYIDIVANPDSHYLLRVRMRR
jgi:hypothetical protein